MRTEKVYEAAIKCKRLSLSDRLRVYLTVGPVAGLLAVIFTVIDYAMWRLLERIQPRETIEIAPDFPLDRYKEVISKY